MVTVWPATVSVPLRGAPVAFTATVYVTVPMPDPLAPPVIVTQLTLLVAVHEHDVPVVTDRLPVVPVDGAEMLVVDSKAVQLLLAWLIVTVWPATVSVPLRGAPVEFTATLYVTVPMPDPLAPPVIVTQLTLLVAVHEHDVPVVTDRLHVVPVDGAGLLVVDSKAVQLLLAWLIVTVWPATVSVPLRGAPVEFTATLYVTVPMPDPLAPPVIVTQATLLVAVHEH